DDVVQRVTGREDGPGGLVGARELGDDFGRGAQFAQFDDAQVVGGFWHSGGSWRGSPAATKKPPSWAGGFRDNVSFDGVRSNAPLRLPVASLAQRRVLVIGILRAASAARTFMPRWGRRHRHRAPATSLAGGAGGGPAMAGGHDCRHA